MNRKEIAVKKAIVVFRTILIPALLLGGPGALMKVQAAGEAQTQQESGLEGVQPETAPEEAVQLQAESAESQAQSEETAAQIQNAEDGMPMPAEGIAEEAQAQSAGAEEAAQAPQPLSVTMIGDSVMLGGSPFILGSLPDCVIDAKVSRQFIEADSVLDSLEQQNAVRQTVVIGLGTNGAFSVAQGQELINRLGSDRTIYWITVFGRELSWQEASNATIRQLAEMNENVHIIDWTQAAAAHPEWICSDGIHLSAAGRDGYAQTVLGRLLQSTNV